MTLITYWIEDERRMLLPLRPAMAKTYYNFVRGHSPRSGG
jgi:hypothetical protein